MTVPAGLAGAVDPAWLLAQRWFGGKGRAVESVEPVAGIEVEPGQGLIIVEVGSEGGLADRYALPVGEAFWPRLIAQLARGEGGAFEIVRLGGELAVSEARSIGRDQSNTTYVLDGRLTLKCYRRLCPAPHPEIELVTFLAGRCPFVPAARAVLTHRDGDGTVWPLALVQDLVPGAQDGWAWACDAFSAELEGGHRPGETTAWARPLGQMAAHLHDALLGLGTRPARQSDRSSWRAVAEAQLEEALEAELPVSAGLRALAPAVAAELAVLDRDVSVRLSRTHGDLHVGQVLRTRTGMHIVDFEGEPTRSPAQRRALAPPLRDVASMLRSFDHAARLRWPDDGDTQRIRLASAWIERARTGFLEGYRESRAGELDPRLLRAFEVEKETYEFVYAARFDPEWSLTALASMEALLASSDAP